MIDVTRWKLSGAVRSLRSEMAEWDAGRDAWQDRRFFQFVAFDERGRVTRLDQRGAHESIHRTIYTFDAQGRVFEEVSGTAGAPASYTRTWTYDDRGRVLTVAATGEEGREHGGSRSTYDAQGGRTEIETFPAHVTFDGYGVDGSEHSFGAPDAASKTTRYDEAGRSVEAVFHDRSGGPIRRVTFECDADGRVLREETEMIGTVPFPGMSDVPGAELAKVQDFLRQALGMRMTYEYDAAGRLLRSTRQQGDMAEDRATYRYDDLGNLVEQDEESVNRDMHFDADGTPRPTADVRRFHHVRFAYVYDARSNWTERVVSTRFREDDGFAPSNVEWRAIDYW